MPDTYKAIATVTVGSGGASSIDFTSIPSTYTDLLIKLSSRGTATGLTWQNIRLRFNADSGNNYSHRVLASLGGNPISGAETTNYLRYSYTDYGDATASTFSNNEYYIANYTSSNNKCIYYETVAENNSATVFALALTGGLWSNSSAITSIAITPDAGGNWAQYSTATLYGIKKD